MKNAGGIMAEALWSRSPAEAGYWECLLGNHALKPVSNKRMPAEARHERKVYKRVKSSMGNLK